MAKLLAMIVMYGPPSVAMWAARRLAESKDANAASWLLVLARSGGGTAKRCAAWALGMSKDSAVVPTLIEVLNSSSDAHCVALAAQSLGQFKDSRSTDSLIASLRHESIRGTVIDALARICDPKARPALEELRRGQDDWLFPKIDSAIRAIEAKEEAARRASEAKEQAARKEAWIKRQVARLEELASNSDPEAIVLAFQALKSGAPEPVRRRAIEVLKAPWQAEQVGPAIRALSDNDVVIRRLAHQVLVGTRDAKFFEIFAKSLWDSDSLVRMDAIRGLAEFNDQRSLEPLMELLNSSASTAAWYDVLQEATAKAVSRSGSASTSTLLRWLAKAENEENRLAFLNWVAKFGDSTCIAPLVGELLKSRESKYQARVAEAIPEVLKREGIKTLVTEVGLKATSAAEAKCVTELLATTDANWAKSTEASTLVPDLIVGLQGNSPVARSCAASLLGQIGDRRAEAPLVKVRLRDSEAGVRRIAEQAILRISPDWYSLVKSTGEAKTFVAALRDPAPYVRAEAAMILRETHDPETISALTDALGETDAEASNSILGAISSFGQAVIPHIGERLRDPDGHVRSNAARVLAGFGKDAESETLNLIACIDDGQPRETVLEAVKALKAIGADATRATVLALDRLLCSPSVELRFDAARLLSSFGKEAEPALTNLIACLDHNQSRETKLEALKALTAIGEAARAAVPAVLPIWKEIAFEASVRFFREVRDGRGVDPILQYLFEGSDRRSGHLVRETLIALAPISTLNEQLIDWVLRASGYEHNYRGYKYDAGFITLEVSDEALKCLCAVKSTVTSNILHLISRKKDVSVTMSTGCSNPWTETVSFQSQRDAALKELAARGTPSYDPEAYLKTGGDEGLGSKIETERQNERRRRYAILLSRLSNPRTDFGEDKWKYYEELAESFPTSDVFRLLAKDLAAHQYIKPSELYKFEGLLTKVGKHLSDSDVRSGLFLFQGPWPNAHKSVLEAIKRQKG
jgi:HEAT repeat protein